MGKDKQGDRAGKGVGRASSAQAAEFLASRGAAAGGFGGFSGAAALGPAATGFGFGAGFASRLAPPGSSSSSNSPPPAAPANEAQLSSDLDGEVAQCLRHLSKKDSTTKLKALQALRALIKTKEGASLALALAPWTFLYAKLSQDPNRTVRTEAAAALGELVAAAGKTAAPHVKTLLPLWWLAQYDPHADAAQAARSAFQACFPGKKQQDALRYALTEVLNHLTEQATSNAQQLGDARKDSPEEMEDRYERVVSAALLALPGLLPALAAPAQTLPTSSSPPPAQQQPAAATSDASAAVSKVWSQVASLLTRPGYIKSCLGSKSPLIRSAGYALVREVAAAVRRQQQQTQAEGVIGSGGEAEEGLAAAASAASGTEVATAVLSVLSDKDPGAHGAMWAMVLSYAKVFPSCWSAVNLRKVFLPRLTALLRHGCYGSHTTSWPALLPLLSLMPRTLLEPSPDVPIQVLEATWRGLLDPSASKAGRAAGVSAYLEVLQWLLIVVAPDVAAALAPAASTAGPADGSPAQPSSEAEEAADTYRLLLIQGSVQAHVLPAALGTSNSPTGAAVPAAELLVQLVKRLAGSASGGSAAAAELALADLQRVLSDSLSALVAASVNAAGVSDSVFTRTDSLISSVRQVHEATGDALAAAVAAALVQTMQVQDAAADAEATTAPQLPPAASTLLATLIRSSSTPSRQPSTASNPAAAPTAHLAHTLDLQGLLRSCMHGEVDSSASVAHVQLLLSWLLGSVTNAEQDWLDAVRTLSGLELPEVVVGDSSSITEPADAVGLQRVLLLVTSLADSRAMLGTATQEEGAEVEEDSPGSGPAAVVRPWERALDALAVRLAQVDTAAAASAVWSAEDTPTAVTALATAPAVRLLSTLLGTGGSHALLVSPTCAERVVGTLCQQAGAHLQSDVPVHVALTPAGCAVFSVVKALLAPGKQQAVGAGAAPTPRAVFHAAPAGMSALVVRVAELAWRHGQTVVSFHRAHAAESDGEVSGEDSDADSGGSVAEAADSSLEAVATELAALAWAQGHALRTAAASLDSTQQATLTAHVVTSLLSWLTQQGTDVAHARRAAAAAVHVQHMVVDPGVRQAVLPELLYQLQQLLQVLVPGCLAAASTAAGSGSKRPAQPQPSATLASVQLFLAHLTHRLGSTMLLNVQAEGRGVETHTLLVHLVAAEASLQLGTAGAVRVGGAASQPRSLKQQARKVVSKAVSRVIVTCLGQPSDGPLGAALQRLFQCLWSGASHSTQQQLAPHLCYPPQLYCSMLLCALHHVAQAAPTHPHQVTSTLDAFASQHLLGEAQRQPPDSGVPPAVLQDLLTLISRTVRSVTSAEEYQALSFPGVVKACVSQSLSKSPVTLDPTLDRTTALCTAVACFPVAEPRAGQALTKGAGHGGLLCTTAEERKLLLQLLKHQCVRHGALAAAKRFGSSPTLDTPGGAEAAASAAAAKAALECAAAAYVGGELQEAEWHTLLSDMQGALSEAVSSVQTLATQLGSTLCEAAGDLVGAGGSDSPAVDLPVALQLLRQLDQKGLLPQHPVYPQLTGAAAAALQAAQLGPALQAVSTCVHVLLQQLERSAGTRTDLLPLGWTVFQSRYRQEFAEVCGKLLSLLLAAGISLHLCATCGQGPAGQWWEWLHRLPGAWASAGCAACAFLDLSIRPGGAGLSSAALEALSSTDTWLASTRLSCLSAIDAMLSLALAPAPPHAYNHAEDGAGAAGDQSVVECAEVLSAAAYTALLHAPSHVQGKLTVAVEQEDEEAQGDMPEYTQGADMVNYLIHAGLHPQLAAVIGADPATQPTTRRLAAWAVLLCHLASVAGSSTDTTTTVRYALGDASPLVPGLLDDLLVWLPLQGYTGGKAAAAAKNHAGSSQRDAAVAAAHDLRSQLRAAGLLQEEEPEQMGRVARVLYGGVLHVLPASARTWFGDLRDRGTALAVEGYTAAVVSPALIAAELKDVQSRGDELRGEQFSVRVSLTAREVVAQLTVEEGSSLELAVKLPASLPLKPPEVECRRRVGVNDTRMRKWLLSISAFLRTNNRGVGDAIAMWRKNVESEFEGVEPCLICYSVVAATNSALPKLQCHTCQVRFHPGCLYKWFKSSGKSFCPHCQSPW